MGISNVTHVFKRVRAMLPFNLKPPSARTTGHRGRDTSVNAGMK